MNRSTPALIALILLAAASTGRAADPSVARPSFPIEGEIQTRGIVFFVEAGGPAKAEVSTADEFNLWCAVNSRPYKLVQHVWDDGAVEWDIEVGTGRDDARVVYGTGQADEALAVIAAFAFIAGADWAAADLTTVGLDDLEEEEGLEDEDDDSEDDDPDDDGRGGTGGGPRGGPRGRAGPPGRGSGGGTAAASASWGEIVTSFPASRKTSRMSISSALANGLPPIRPLSVRYRYLPLRAFWNVSRAGVAEPRTTVAPRFFARTTAASRAL